MLILVLFNFFKWQLDPKLPFSSFSLFGVSVRIVTDWYYSMFQAEWKTWLDWLAHVRALSGTINDKILTVHIVQYLIYFHHTLVFVIEYLYCSCIIFITKWVASHVLGYLFYYMIVKPIDRCYYKLITYNPEIIGKTTY